MSGTAIIASRGVTVLALHACLCMYTDAVCAQGTAMFQGLGDLPGDPFGSQARGVSADGSVVVGTGTTKGTRPFRWTASGGMVELPDGGAFEHAEAVEVSGDGLTTVGSTNAGNPPFLGCYWIGAVFHDFANGNPRAASSDGSIMTGGMEGGAFRYANGTQTLLGAGALSIAHNISSDGSTIVGAIGASNGFRWTQAGGVTNLPLYALDASADGSVVVGKALSGGAYQPARWTQASGLQFLAPPTPFGGDADGISASGNLIGINAPPLPARIWTPDSGLRDLKQVLLDAGATGVSGWTLYAIRDMTSDGQFVVGYGLNPAGGIEAFLARLPPSDTDGDGLLDSWESEGQGLDVNGDGTMDLDLYALGARPDHKDLFIEIDSMTGRLPADLAPVVAAFNAAPVANPDSVSGVRLHLHIDDTDLPLEGGWPVDPWPVQFDNLKSLYFGTAAERTDANSIAILEAKHKAFRYCIYADTSLNAAAVGVARNVHANDFIVFKGELMTLSPPWEQATFMHELGHCLGLHHGGGDEIHLKPNYISVMNYLYDLPFDAGVAWRLDFSRGTMLPIIEGNIDESVMLDDPTGHNVGVLTYHAFSNCPPSTCDLTPTGLVPALGYLIGSSPRDFNGDGQINSGQCMDLNYYGTNSPVAEGGVHTPCDVMNDHNDWASLEYALVEQASPLTGGPPTNPPLELTIAEIQALHAALPGPPCLADIVGNDVVDIDDLLAVISAWGPCPGLPALCSADIAPLPVDGAINIDDLLAVISAWGPCP